MSKQTINNLESGSSVREKINSNFTEIYNQEIDSSAVALTDAATIDITGPKHTLTTATGRTFTISHAGDEGTIEITLNATSATMTMPAGTKCWSEGTASGGNTFSMAGVSGDIYIVSIIKIGSNYYCACSNSNR